MPELDVTGSPESVHIFHAQRIWRLLSRSSAARRNGSRKRLSADKVNPGNTTMPPTAGAAAHQPSLPPFRRGSFPFHSPPTPPSSIGILSPQKQPEHFRQNRCILRRKGFAISGNAWKASIAGPDNWSQGRCRKVPSAGPAYVHRRGADDLAISRMKGTSWLRTSSTARLPVPPAALWPKPGSKKPA
ncbi:hypothetical protein BR10RB9215_C12191 [Brucella sp. 10RB9215]|nr:hypothetical protein BR10RB9215_C12191 [Brucella sp. 10RB9215]